MADQFVLVRITNMRGADLTIFDFDYDLTWAGFFMNANQKIYGRYGGRNEGHAESMLSLKGLKYAMKSALEAYSNDRDCKARLLDRSITRVEDFPAAKRVAKNRCIHCHQVYDFRRDWMVQNKTWTPNDVWVYPPPENIGLVMDSDQGDLIERVIADSAAQKAGVKPGSQVVKANSIPISSYGDLQYALHNAPNSGSIPLVWKHDKKTITGKIELKPGWRMSDISWRGSMWGLEPKAHVYGRDLTAGEKKDLGIPAKQLAFSQGNYVPPRAQQAGIRGGDVIIGADGKKLEMTMLQFNVWVRLNYKDGDRIVYNVVRKGKRLNIPLELKNGG